MKVRAFALGAGLAVAGLLPTDAWSAEPQGLSVVPLNESGTNPFAVPVAPRESTSGPWFPGFSRPRQPAPSACPPAVPLYPSVPLAPGANPVGPDAPRPSDVAGQTPPGSSGGAESALAQGTEGGGAAATSFNPNMMGDLLGTRSLRIAFSAPLAALFNVSQNGFPQGLSGVYLDPNRIGPGPANITIGPGSNGRTFSVKPPYTSTDLTYFQPFSSTTSVDRAFAQAALQTLFSKGPLSAETAQQLDKLTPANRAALLANRGVFNRYVAAASGFGLPQVTVSNVSALPANQSAAVQYNATLFAETVIPLPGAGGLVGRLKASEDNNPMPRDRLIFNYDYFDNVPFTNNGLNVNKFSFGAEKTFGDGRWSGEVRLPFASTLAATYTDGLEMRDVQLGNLRFVLKHLLATGEYLTFSTGLALTLPTAKDQEVLSADDGLELYRFKNRSVTLEPFLAALWTPTDRLFAQVWGAVNFDASGGELNYNPNVFGGSGSVRYFDRPLLAVDGQIGYRLIREAGGLVRGLAPFLELHYNQFLGRDGFPTTTGSGLTVSTIGNKEFNLTAGVAARLGDHTNVALGASAPLLKQPDRTFNVQFALRVNYLYGRSAGPNAPLLTGIAGR